MWVPPEETDPVLLHAPTRKSGAVNLRTGQFVTQCCSPFNAITFGTFLRTLLRPLLTEKRHLLSLSFLLPYSPALNPIERVWKLARKLCTHYFPLLADLVTAVSAQLDLRRTPNPVLARLCGTI